MAAGQTLRPTDRGAAAGGGSGLSRAGGAFDSQLQKAERERYSDFLLFFANRWCSPAGFLSSAGVC